MKKISLKYKMANQDTYSFQDVEFMTARKKQLVLKNWKTFLKHGLRKEHFTKRLYQHLHLHCGFIAHYNIHGFYSTYFEAGQDTERFFEQFCSNVNGIYGAGDYNDLDTAMLETYRQFKDGILAKAQTDINHRLDVLGTCIEQARKNDKFAREFLSNVGM